MDIKRIVIPQSNYSTNHGANQLKKIVLHWVVGEISSCDATFLNPTRQASAHYCVGSNGEVHQYVEDKDIAWHAGPKVNFESIGIEHAGGQLLSDGTRKKPTQVCHDTSAELVAMKCKQYNIPCDREHIRKHSEYMSTSCLPISSELLTPFGWKNLDKITKQDLIAQWNSDIIEFVNPLSIVKPYEADVYNMKIFTATPDHRIIRYTSRGKEDIKSLEELTKYVNFTIPTTGHFKASGLNISDDLLRLLVFVQADGHYSISKNGKNVESIIFHLKKDRKIEFLKSILDKLGKDYSCYQKGDGSYDFCIYGQDWIKENILKHLPKKDFTWEFLELTNKQANIFLDTIVLADGHINEDGSCRYYSNTHKESVDIVQAVAHLHGKSTILTTILYDNNKRKTSYRLGFRDVNLRTIYSQNKKNEKMIVSCVEVPSGKILVRQGKYVFVIGNCPGTLDIDYIISKANSIINNLPMATLNFEIIIQDKNLHVKILSGSFNGTATIKNLTAGTTWTTTVNRSAGEISGIVCQDFGESLYEVSMGGVTKQIDLRKVDAVLCGSFPTKCKIMFNDTIVRINPNRNNPPVATLQANTAVDIVGYSVGENVNGTNIWCYTGTGYIHKSLLALDDSLEVELMALRKKTAEQEDTIIYLSESVDKLTKQVADNASQIKILMQEASEFILAKEQALKDLKTCQVDKGVLEKRVVELEEKIKDLQDGETQEDLINKISDLIKRIFEWIKSKLKL
jgi:uncharacterized coiled-coil protein SlyX